VVEGPQALSRFGIQLATDEKVVELEGHSDWVRSLAFFPDSTRVASGSYEIVRSTTTGELLAGLEHTHWVRNGADSDELAGLDDWKGSWRGKSKTEML
jgi:WD40 repeat protein